jgi:hypothetical protein
VPVPRQLVRTPRVSRRFAAAKNTIYVHPAFSFRPPSTTLFRSRPTMGSRLLRADKKLSHRQGSSIRPCEPTRAKSRGGYLCAKVRISIYARHAPVPNHAGQTQTPFSRYMRHPHAHAEARSCMVCKGWIGGGSKGGWGGNSTKCTGLSAISRSRHLLVACARHCSHWQLPGSTIEGEDRRRREERMRGCNEGCGRMAHLLYASLDPWSPRQSPLKRRRSTDSFVLEFVFRKQ